MKPLALSTFLNLIQKDWVTRINPYSEFVLLIISGAFVGCALSLVRPLAPTGAAFGLGMLLAAVAGLLYCFNLWFSWLLIAGVQIPIGVVCSLLWHFRKAQKDKLILTEQLADAGLIAPALGIMPAELLLAGGTAKVGDYVLIRPIGKGAYGQVFLARNAIGLYQAVKVVYNTNFGDAKPYEREFRGIQKYMPISLNHPGLAHVLSVGRNDKAGYFYYAMELGDDLKRGAQWDPVSYIPPTLAEEFKDGRRFSVKECLEMFLSLTEALDFLHQQRLVHRDIKPSNIIFVKGIPKFADIGLVTDIAPSGSEISYVGKPRVTLRRKGRGRLRLTSTVSASSFTNPRRALIGTNFPNSLLTSP